MPDAAALEPTNGFFAGGSRHPRDLAKGSAPQPNARALHAAQLATYVAPKRGVPEARTARGRLEAKPARQKRQGPTPERLAKGDISDAPTAAGFHVAIAPIFRLYKEKKLGETREHVRENLVRFQAAERLKQHFDRKNAIGVKAQDLTRVTGTSTNDGEELSWVIHDRHFQIAKKLMRFSDTNETHGSARMVIAVVCEEMTVTEAAELYLPPGRKEVMLATAMEKIRDGLWILAVHWGFA